MKIKLGISAILLSTLGLIALIYGVVNLEAPKVESEALPPTREAKKPELSKIPTIVDKKIVQAKPKPDQEPNQEALLTDLSVQDREIINNIASLSEKALVDELDSLKTRIEKEDLVGQLEDGDLEEKEILEAKSLLERFALLDLEGTRRKYQNIEPELKNPLYAHRDSLKEIREMLDEY